MTSLKLVSPTESNTSELNKIAKSNIISPDIRKVINKKYGKGDIKKDLHFIKRIINTLFKIRNRFKSKNQYYKVIVGGKTYEFGVAEFSILKKRSVDLISKYIPDRMKEIQLQKSANMKLSNGFKRPVYLKESIVSFFREADYSLYLGMKYLHYTYDSLGTSVLFIGGNYFYKKEEDILPITSSSAITSLFAIYVLIAKLSLGALRNSDEIINRKLIIKHREGIPILENTPSEKEVIYKFSKGWYKADDLLNNFLGNIDEEGSIAYLVDQEKQKNYRSKLENYINLVKNDLIVNSTINFYEKERIKLGIFTHEYNTDFLDGKYGRFNKNNFKFSTIQTISSKSKYNKKEILESNEISDEIKDMLYPERKDKMLWKRISNYIQIPMGSYLANAKELNRIYINEVYNNFKKESSKKMFLFGFLNFVTSEDLYKISYNSIKTSDDEEELKSMIDFLGIEIDDDGDLIVPPRKMNILYLRCILESNQFEISLTLSLIKIFRKLISNLEDLSDNVYLFSFSKRFYNKFGIESLKKYENKLIFDNEGNIIIDDEEIKEYFIKSYGEDYEQEANNIIENLNSTLENIISDKNREFICNFHYFDGISYEEYKEIMKIEESWEEEEEEEEELEEEEEKET